MRRFLSHMPDFLTNQKNSVWSWRASGIPWQSCPGRMDGK